MILKLVICRGLKEWGVEKTPSWITASLHGTVLRHIQTIFELNIDEQNGCLTMKGGAAVLRVSVGYIIIPVRNAAGDRTGIQRVRECPFAV